MQQIITDVGKDVGDFLKDFTTNYVIQLVNSKIQNVMDETVDAIMPSAFAKDDEEEDDGVDAKGLEEKADIPPIAAGCALIGYRIGYGPDRAYHRYFDFAVWSVKEKDSVISKVVRRHTSVHDWFVNLKKKIPTAPDHEFPKKKFFGRNDQYYVHRFATMRSYFRAITPVQLVSTNDYFLTFWNLKYDAKRAAAREIFFAALKVTCEASGIDWNTAKWRAETLGLDLDEAEMLKVVAVEKVGAAATQRIRDQVYSLAYIPGPVKGKFISSTEAKLAGMISTSVDTAWNGAKETFNKIADALNDVLDKGVQPIKDMLAQATEPIGKIVKEKFDKLDQKLDSDDGLDRTVKATRFPPLTVALNTLANGKCADAVPPLIQSIDKMNAAHNYVGYLRYNLGDPEYGQYVPYLNEIQENHYRLTIALTDVAYVLSRAGVNSFEPLLKYVDKIGDSGFDEKTHEKQVQDAVREGGRRLAIDYFSLPQTVGRACWYCGRTTEKLVLKVGETTTWALADLLGATVTNWKPTSKDDAKAKFVEALKGPLDEFITDRVKTFVTAVRKATANIIARQLMSVVGSAIDSIAETLNNLCAALPDPIGKNLKGGDVVKYLLEKMADNCVTIGVKFLAKKTESIMYTEGAEAQALNEYDVWRYRWAPRIRNYDDDTTEPEKEADDKKKEDEKKADTNNGGDANNNNANSQPADNAQAQAQPQAQTAN